MNTYNIIHTLIKSGYKYSKSRQKSLKNLNKRPHKLLYIEIHNPYINRAKLIAKLYTEVRKRNVNHQS